jgi:hypothetical protein
MTERSERLHYIGLRFELLNHFRKINATRLEEVSVVDVHTYFSMEIDIEASKKNDALTKAKIATLAQSRKGNHQFLIEDIRQRIELVADNPLEVNFFKKCLQVLEREQEVISSQK